MNDKNFSFTPEFYDLQVNWESRLEKEKDFFIRIFKEYNIKNVLDIGCGTAHHAQFFSEYVEKVIAIDPSKEMIDYARKNVIKSSNITLVKGGFEDLDKLFSEKFDLIVSLGNTLPILGTRRKVKLALKKTRKKLSQNGIAIFQFLNFSPKVIEKNRFYYPKIVNEDSKTYIFIKHFEYGKLNTEVDFLITVINDQKAIEDFFINSSLLCTLEANLFLRMAENSGFKNVKMLGPAGKNEFSKKNDVSLYAILSS